jgi:hypothetical protein
MPPMLTRWLREINEETMGGNTQILTGYAPAVPSASAPSPYTNINLPHFNTDGEAFEDPDCTARRAECRAV